MKNNIPDSNKILEIMMKIFVFSIFLILISSCNSFQNKNVITWNVELKDNDLPITDKCNPDKKLQAIQTTEKPVIIPASEENEARIKILGLACDDKTEQVSYNLPLSRVKRITYLSDPLSPPQEITTSELAFSQVCCRVRDGALIFDKFEIRGVIGFRGVKDSINYLLSDGNLKTYNSSFVNFDRGGSTLLLGLESVGLWNVPFIDEKGNFQAGIILGLMPTDEAWFIPLGLHTRYTFNQTPSATSNNCNTWYLYANAGLPLDFQTKSPLFGKSSEFQKYFYGFGIGYDWAINCDMDFSIDLGIRVMNLPLPACEACSQISDEDRFPYRNSKALLLRFGLTY